MSDLHIWVGLLAGWVLYAMFLTGSVSYFKEEISQWARPSVPAYADTTDRGVVAEKVVQHMQHIAPRAPSWFIALPNGRQNTATVSWRGEKRFETATFDPAIGERITQRETRGGDFFYRFHFSLHYLPVLLGRWIAGLCAMFMLVAIISGIITHKKIFRDFFTFRWGKGQRSWLDAHNALSVLGLPFHLMITYTGLVTLMFLYMPWGVQAAYPTTEARAEFQSRLSAYVREASPAGHAAPLISVGELTRHAEHHWQGQRAGTIQVIHPGDAAASVVIKREDAARISFSPQYLVFDGVTGALRKEVGAAGPVTQTLGVTYGLHLGRFADIVTRWLYFLLSLAGTAMVGTGLVLWTVKRRARLPDPTRPHLGFRLVERLNIASIAGLSVAMASFLWAVRLLPGGMAGRSQWEVHTFFIVWALTLIYALARPARKAWVELLWLAAVALALVPLVNALTSHRNLIASLKAGDWVFAGFDLTLLALAVLHAVLARRTARHKPRLPKATAARGVAVTGVTPQATGGQT